MFVLLLLLLLLLILLVLSLLLLGTDMIMIRWMCGVNISCVE